MKKLEKRNLFTFSQKVFFVCFFIFGIGIATKAGAKTYYVRPAGGSYGSENGSSYEDAWDGTVNIDWDNGDGTGVGAGDTLFVCGTHYTKILVNATGTENNPIVIDGGCPGDSGTIYPAQQLTSWTDIGGGIYTTGGSVCIFLIEDDYPLKKASGITLSDGNWFQSGSLIYYRPTSGTPSDHIVRRAHGSPTTGQGIAGNNIGDYITIKNLTIKGAINAVYFSSTNAENSHITVDNCNFHRNMTGIYLVQREQNNNGHIITNNTISESSEGILFSVYSGAFINSDSVISGNVITNTGNVGEYTWEEVVGYSLDDEAIGLQNVKNCIISSNTISEGAEGGGIVIWSNTTGLGGNKIYKNYIHDLRGAGIIPGGAYPDNSNSPMVTFNVIYNCGLNSSAYNGGLRLNRFQSPISKISNNTLFGNDVSLMMYSLTDYYSIKNNLSSMPLDYHTYRGEDGIRHNILGYNLYYSSDSEIKFFYTGTVYNFAGWKTQTFQDASSFFSNPYLSDPNNSDFRLLWNSPAIDAGVHVDGVTQNCSGICTDYAGNPIYGPPDIGAYEYQPPYKMGTDEVDIAADVRVYGDGKFRNTRVAGGIMADLAVSPTSNDISEYLDIKIATWETTGNYSKAWTENSSTITGSVDHTVGDLEAGKYYKVQVDGAIANLTGCATVGSDFVCQADAQGRISFSYNGTYSEHAFVVEEGDNTAPAFSNLVREIKYPAGTDSVTFSFNTDEAAVCKYSSIASVAFADMTGAFETTGSTTHSFSLANLASGHSYSFYVKCRDATGNITADQEFSFLISPLEYLPILAVGNHKVYSLTSNAVISVKSKYVVFRGKIDSLKGGRVQVFQDGSLKKQDKIRKSKRWRARINENSRSATHTYYFRYYSSDGRLVETSQRFIIMIDRRKPEFAYLPKKIQARSGDIIKWKAFDNDQIKYYEYKFKGSISKTSNSSFSLPENIRKGIYRFKVKAFDRAGNWRVRRTKIKVFY